MSPYLIYCKLLSPQLTLESKKKPSLLKNTEDYKENRMFEPGRQALLSVTQPIND